MDQFEKDFDKNFSRMMKGGMVGGCLLLIVQLALIVLICWGIYEGIMWLREQ
jgi:hypothetical protein